MDLKNPPQETDYPQEVFWNDCGHAQLPNSPPPPPTGKKLNLPMAAWLALVPAGTHSLAKL